MSEPEHISKILPGILSDAAAKKGIPTKYKGVQCRSRLEATWAGFFDKCGWEWEYEPVDFNGWIPDFAIYGKEIVYVEIKPVVKFPQDVADKVDMSGCDKEVLILGQTVPLSRQDFGVVSFGWLKEVYEKEDNGSVSGWWERAVMGYWENGKGKIGFSHEQGSFVDRISGGYDGGCHGSLTKSYDLMADKVRAMWCDAKNEVQWKARK